MNCFKSISSIPLYHHFLVSKVKHGILTVGEYAESNELDVSLFNKKRGEGFKNPIISRKKTFINPTKEIRPSLAIYLLTKGILHLTFSCLVSPPDGGHPPQKWAMVGFGQHADCKITTT